MCEYTSFAYLMIEIKSEDFFIKNNGASKI